MFKEIIHPCSSQELPHRGDFLHILLLTVPVLAHSQNRWHFIANTSCLFSFLLPNHSFLCTQSKDRDQLSSLTFWFHNFSVSFHGCSSRSTPTCASYILLQICVRDLLLTCVVKCLRQAGLSILSTRLLPVRAVLILSPFPPGLCLVHAKVWSSSLTMALSNLTLHAWWTSATTGDVIVFRFLIFCLCPKPLVAVTPSFTFYRQLQKLLGIIKSPCLLPVDVLNQLFSLFLTSTADLTSS